MSRVVIIICGTAGQGKDTLADILASQWPGLMRDSYAAPLKECVHLKTGIPMSVLHGTQEAKENPAFGRYGKTPRKLMQEEGEEARQRISTTIWMDRAAERAMSAPEHVTIISDGRHPKEEIAAMRSSVTKGTTVVVVRIVRPSVAVVRGHISEDAIADASDSIFDVVVMNDGSLEDLMAKAQQLVDFVWLKAKTGKPRSKGWIVACPTGHRRPEPMALRDEADVLSKQLVEPCVFCRSADDHSPVPVSFDLLKIV